MKQTPKLYRRKTVFWHKDAQEWVQYDDTIDPVAGQQKGGNAWEAMEPDTVNQGPATAHIDGEADA